MFRLFVPPEWIKNDRIRLEGEVAHRVSRVLRMTPGSQIVLLDNSGMEYTAQLTLVGPTAVEGAVISSQTGAGEPKAHITLYQGTLKGSKLEWVLQKGTELGIAIFVPMICGRSIPDEEATMAGHRYPRWRKIIAEAAEQSGRSKLPLLLEPMPFPKACQAAGKTTLALIPWEQERLTGLDGVLRGQRLDKVSIFIGPEGGYEEEEVAYARSQGVAAVSLGRRVLRAETAGLVAAAAVLYAAGELGTG